MAYNFKSNRVKVPREEYIRLLGVAVEALYAIKAEMTAEIVARRAVRGTHAEYSAMLTLLRRGLTEREREIAGVPRARNLSKRILWYDGNGNRNT